MKQKEPDAHLRIEAGSRGGRWEGWGGVGGVYLLDNGEDKDSGGLERGARTQRGAGDLVLALTPSFCFLKCFSHVSFSATSERTERQRRTDRVTDRTTDRHLCLEDRQTDRHGSQTVTSGEKKKP